MQTSNVYKKGHIFNFCKVGSWWKKNSPTLVRTQHKGFTKIQNNYTKVIQTKQRQYIWGKMHMSDTISAAFCDLSEISCHWGLKHSLFNSAGDCHVPNAPVTVSSCLRTRKTYLNKRAWASPVGDMYCTATTSLLTMLAPCLFAGDAADMWTHSRLTQSFTQESKAKSDLHHMWHTYDGSKLICDAWLKQENCGRNQSRVASCSLWADSSRWLQLRVLLLHRPLAHFLCHCSQSFHKLLVKLFSFASGGLSKSNFLVLWKEMFEHISYCSNAGHVLCQWAQQKWRVRGIISV